MKDSRIGKRIEIHPRYDLWMRGDKYGEIVSVSRKTYSYVDPRDWRNGKRFVVQMDKSKRLVRIPEGDVTQWID